MKPGRNEPCPCGSGFKVKRCCGVDGARRSQEAAEDLFGLAFHFPRYRPSTPAFDAWAASAAPDELTRGTLEAGLDVLGEEERVRIATGFAADYPQMWSSLVAELRDEEAAVQLVLAGAVVAGLDEAGRRVDPQALELIEAEDEVRADAVEVLALALEARDLWSVIESSDAVEAFDAGSSILSIADRLATDWHDARLAVLVERLDRLLPIAGRPLASAVIADARRAFAGDERIRRRLRAELLLDSLPTVWDAISAAA